MQTDDPSTLAFLNLEPAQILGALEDLGFRCDGRLLALNSYENRVYQVGIEDAEPVIVKFYRPGRWSEAQIREEAEFECLRIMLGELAAECSLTLEEVEDLFANVSCRMDALVDVLCGEKSNALVWNALEDMALKHEPEAQEY